MRFNLCDCSCHILEKLSSTGIRELVSKEKTEPSLDEQWPPPAPLLHSPFLPQSVPCLHIQGPQLPHPPFQSVACLCSQFLIHSKVHSCPPITDRTHAMKSLDFWTDSHRNEVPLHLLEPRPQLLHLHHQSLHLFLNMLDNQWGFRSSSPPPDIVVIACITITWYFRSLNSSLKEFASTCNSASTWSVSVKNENNEEQL